MKKIISLILIFIASVIAYSMDSITIAWDKNPETNVVEYTVYFSTNDFIENTNSCGVGTNLTAELPVGYDIPYRLIVTAKDEFGLESEPSRIIYFTQQVINPDENNNLILTGTNDWSNAILLSAPTNGVISGTLPTLTYTVTNNTAISDNISYIIDDSNETNASHYYSFDFTYTNNPPNNPPNIRIKF